MSGKSAQELVIMNGKLTATPYVSGFTPSKEDAAAFKEMFGGNTATVQWAARMASYYQSEREEISGVPAGSSSAAAAGGNKAKHADPSAATGTDPAPLIANFKKFAGDKSAYFMFINLEYTNDLCNFISGPEGFSPQEILGLLTDPANSAKLADAYFKIAKTSEKKQEKTREEIKQLVTDFMDSKVGGVKTLKAVDAKPKVVVDPETAGLIAGFAKFVAETQTHKNTTAKMLKVVLDYLPEGFHKADINCMLTDGDDCDELLETYVRLAVVPSSEKLRARQELVAFVEAFAEAGCPKAAPQAAAPAAAATADSNNTNAAPLIANFKKFAGDKSAYFMFINLEYTLDVCNFISGPEGYSPQEIQTLLTDSKNCGKLCDAYIKIAKTSEKKQEKTREEIVKLVADFMDPKVGGVKTLKPTESKAAVVVDPETATLIAEFAKFVEGKTQKNTTPKMLKAVLEYLPEGFHKADIKTMLTNGEDCDELLETYVRLAVVPSAEKLRARNELVSFVEAFAESKGITHEEMCF